ncbi:hypothetical protein Dimus_033067 [Dionaea muscipula]
MMRKKGRASVRPKLTLRIKFQGDFTASPSDGCPPGAKSEHRVTPDLDDGEETPAAKTQVDVDDTLSRHEGDGHKLPQIVEASAEEMSPHASESEFEVEPDELHDDGVDDDGGNGSGPTSMKD